MPQDATSPFTPGRPVPVDFFVGRTPEIERVRSRARMAAKGRIEAVFLTGERGIGKSSLASFARHLVQTRDGMLGLHVFLGGVTTLTELARAVFDRLANVALQTPWWNRVKDLFGRHIRQIGLFGINVVFDPPEEDLRRLIGGFAAAIRKLLNSLEPEMRGLFLVLDDLNGLAGTREFANWLKSTVDEAATAEHGTRLCLVLVGLDERRQALVQSNPSLARVFDLVHVGAWSDEETEDFFRRSFGKVSVRVDEKALATFVHFAGGLPVLAHEIGDAAFSRDMDNFIGAEEALEAVRAAADIVGRKHLQPQVFEAIRSRRYRSILNKLSSMNTSATFRRAEIIARLPEEERKVFDNFAQRMKQLGVIVPDPDGGPGAYQFSNLLHALYFRMEAERERKTHRRGSGA